MNEYRVPHKDLFMKEVDRSLGFLVSRFGFTPFDHEREIQNPSMYLSFGFRNDELELWVESDRGCFDLIVRLTKEVPWLRPYMSKMFSLSEIVRHAAAEELKTIEGGCGEMMQTYGRWLKTYCTPILDKDYSLLETVNRLRTSQ